MALTIALGEFVLTATAIQNNLVRYTVRHTPTGAVRSDQALRPVADPAALLREVVEMTAGDGDPREDEMISGFPVMVAEMTTVWLAANAAVSA